MVCRFCLDFSVTITDLHSASNSFAYLLIYFRPLVCLLFIFLFLDESSVYYGINTITVNLKKKNYEKKKQNTKSDW